MQEYHIFQDASVLKRMFFLRILSVLSLFILRQSRSDYLQIAPILT